MKQVDAVPWNGCNVVSTFSGCGGSSLGYRMAGFKVLWASEFIHKARESYNANKSPETILDPRDIRNVSADDILKSINLKKGEIDLFDGSPPCASFSTAGKREKAWGQVKKYSDKSQRVDDLFFEYTRLLKDLQPKTFVAENVSGLVKGAAKGYFKIILSELKKCGYRVSAKLLNAAWLGVPQFRERLIFIGVRDDLKMLPKHPMPMDRLYSYKNAMDGFKPADGDCYRLKNGSKLRAYWGKTPEGESFAVGSEISHGKSTAFQMSKIHRNRPVPTVVQSSQGLHHYKEPRTLTIGELKRVSGFPDDFILTGSFQKKWERVGRAVPPLMMQRIGKTVYDRILKL